MDDYLKLENAKIIISPLLNLSVLFVTSCLAFIDFYPGICSA